MPETMTPARNGGPDPDEHDLDEPGERECLLCYLGRMMAGHGCDNTKRWTIRWRDRRAPGDDTMMTELEERGGVCCDCEVVMNVWEYDDADEDDQAAPRPCLGAEDAGDPLSLCGRWPGWSLRDPHYDDDDEDDYEEEYFDYET